MSQNLDPDRVFIRAKVDGRWDSVSITEAPASSVFNWWMKKALDYDEGAILTKAHRQDMLDILDMLNVQVVQLKAAPSAKEGL